MAPVLDAKKPRQRPFMERRYNFWYGNYNGEMNITSSTKRCQEKKCHNVAKKFAGKMLVKFLLQYEIVSMYMNGLVILDGLPNQRTDECYERETRYAR